MSAMTQAIKRAMVDGQDLGLKGAPLRRYIEKDTNVSGDLIDNILAEIYADMICRITPNLEVTFNAAAAEALRASGLTNGRSLSVEMQDGQLVIGDRDG